ncbi:unnamed protein product [Protopolystoma xenopodis]|uniref:Biogenesis of lysosome-related organelles complex 1 subunit 7 n=1 Tax=Protopolystoma xenopodis TaxID=117903 RepID=A0A448WC93_9PLAT|nr:unnamed protein product [Protopolystoma xenopodis]
MSLDSTTTEASPEPNTSLVTSSFDSISSASTGLDVSVAQAPTILTAHKSASTRISVSSRPASVVCRSSSPFGPASICVNQPSVPSSLFESPVLTFADKEAISHPTKSANAQQTTTDLLTLNLFNGLLKPSLSKVDAQITKLLTVQADLKRKIDNLSEELCKISELVSQPFELQVHLTKLNDIRARTFTVLSSLQKSQGAVQYLRGLDISEVHFGPGTLTSHTRSTSIDHGSNNKSTTIGSGTSPPMPNGLWPSPDILGSMCRLQWLKLRSTGLTGGDLPHQLAQLTRLESLTLSRNQLQSLSLFQKWSELFPALRCLNCRKNCLSDASSIPIDLFNCPNLQLM